LQEIRSLQLLDDFSELTKNKTPTTDEMGSRTTKFWWHGLQNPLVQLHIMPF
jgi:hypothetical protein